MGNSDDLIARDDAIEAGIRALATEDELPVRAIATCLRRMEAAAPLLRAAVEKAIVDPNLSDDDYTLFIRGLFILGGGRDAGACGLLDRLVRRPSHIVEELLGDIVTEDLSRLLASVFDGDAGRLFTLIGDRGVDEFVRGAAQGCATFLTAEGRIERADMREFLRHFWETKDGEPSAFIWVRWVEAIGLLGLHELIPLVDRAFAEGQIDPTFMGREHFDADLAAAERDDPKRFSDNHLGYIEDVAKSLAWSRHASQQPNDDGYVPIEPLINPHRNVGRNDPCPCGSGKKFKKCCLAA